MKTLETDLISCSGIVIRNKANQVCLELSCEDDGAAKVVFMNLGSPVLSLNTDSTGRATITFFTKAGANTIGIGIGDDDTPGISVIDPVKLKMCIISSDGLVKAGN